MAESQKIGREISGGIRSDDELEHVVIIDPNARQIYGDAYPSFLKMLLRKNLSREQTPVEMEIEEATNKAMQTLNSTSRPSNQCTREEICGLLKKAGYNNACICKSKWKATSEMLGGQHTYIQVTQHEGEGSNKNKNKNKKIGDNNIIIELNFRDEFTVHKPTKEYESLVSLLPEIFVGEGQTLRNLVRIMCCALEICMEEKKMYMGPWRKENYMQAKWKGKPQNEEDSSQKEDSCQKVKPQFLPVDLESRKPRSKESLLTLELSKP